MGANRFYRSSPWVRLRAKHIARQPACVRCGGPGKVVDHIVTVRKAPHRALDPTNLQTMCLSCHSKSTQSYDAGRIETRGANAAGYPTSPDHPWFRADQVTAEDLGRWRKGKRIGRP